MSALVVQKALAAASGALQPSCTSCGSWYDVWRCPESEPISMAHTSRSDYMLECLSVVLFPFGACSLLQSDSHVCCCADNIPLSGLLWTGMHHVVHPSF